MQKFLDEGFDVIGTAYSGDVSETHERCTELCRTFCNIKSHLTGRMTAYKPNRIDGFISRTGRNQQSFAF